jgi:hypothetical protein
MSDRFVSLPVVRDNGVVVNWFFNVRHVIRVRPTIRDGSQCWLSATPEEHGQIAWKINLPAGLVVDRLEDA